MTVWVQQQTHVARCGTRKCRGSKRLGFVHRFSPGSKRAMIRSWRESEIASAKGLNLAVLDAVQQPLDRDATEIVELTVV